MSVQKAAKRVSDGRAALKGRGGKHRRRPKAIAPEILTALTEGITDLRDRAIVLLLIGTGLRGSELTLLNRGMISLNGAGCGGTGELPLPKSKISRRFYVPRAAVDALEAYLNFERGQDCNAALFIDAKGNRLKTSYLRRMVRRRCDQLGIERLSVHQFRHTFAVRLVDGGASPLVLKELMGHSIWQTTAALYFPVKSKRT